MKIALILAFIASSAAAFSPSILKMSVSSPSQQKVVPRRQALGAFGLGAVALLSSPTTSRGAEVVFEIPKGSLSTYDPKMNREDNEKATRVIGMDKAKAKAERRTARAAAEEEKRVARITTGKKPAAK
jgi:hypothetical protein